jgi:phosphoribosylglycinamide formyltransferase-1
MYGVNVHAQVLAAGDKETGVTIHVVNDEYDAGPILVQRKVPVLEGDTAETLENRVLEVEHQIYVETIEKIISGEIQLPAKQPGI